ncbi:MAG: ABC transporter permease [Ignavibacteriae bacterium]|nr:ABC transporter permease [Ignavibacteriota bacterium]
MKTIDFRETVGLALAALKANKLRAFLTLLGVVIGVFSFIGVMTAISVLQDTIVSSFDILGSNTLNVQKYPAMQHGPETRMKYRNRKDITVEQGMYIRDASRLAEHVCVQSSYWPVQITYKNRKTEPNIGLDGTTPEIIYTENRVIADGRMFTEQELQYGKNVIVLGPKITERLFPREDPLGKTVRVDNISFMVVGVTESKGGLFGSQMDNFAAVPLTTFLDHFGKTRWVGIQAKAASPDTYDAMTDEVIGLLRAIRKVPAGDENDFEIVSNETLISEVNNMTLQIRIGSGAVSAIALLAAGIGIMNIMLVSVTERTREIGVRKAVGATRNSILRQFLIEAIVICQLGGFIGIIVGLGGGNLVAFLLEIPPVLPIGWALLGLFVTTLIGVIFGVYPAWKAANLDPIEALRYE